MSKAPKPKSQQQGFTLLETLMAGMVFMISVTGVLLMSLHTTSNASNSTINMEMAQLANRILMERTALGPTGLGTDGVVTVPYDLAGETERIDGGSGRMVQVTIEVGPVDGGTERQITVTIRRKLMSGKELVYVQSQLAITPPN